VLKQRNRVLYSYLQSFVFTSPQEALTKLNGVKRYRNPHGGFATGMDLKTEEEKERQQLRSARFGPVQPDFVPPPEPTIPQDDMQVGKLKIFQSVFYSPQDKIQSVEPMKEAPIDIERRYDTLYLYGVDKLDSESIFQYFSEYGPTFVEWIDDSSGKIFL
jgi:hypothetical protein